MRTSHTTSSEQLAGALARFIGTVMKGDQSELFSLIAELELTMAQMRGLFVLDASDHGLALTELAPHMGLSVAAAGRAIDGLVRNGLVSRTEDPADRRIKRLAPTAAGRAALGRIQAARLAGLRRFADTLGERERDALAGALTAIFAQWESEGTEEAR
ncbi:MAG: MarR family transcriptional regulator [Actinobacteria bacterium]|nr:MarR family transcriptional regulator [Actinomycetota bacterium]